MHFSLYACKFSYNIFLSFLMINFLTQSTNKTESEENDQQHTKIYVIYLNILYQIH